VAEGFEGVVGAIAREEVDDWSAGSEVELTYVGLRGDVAPYRSAFIRQWIAYHRENLILCEVDAGGGGACLTIDDVARSGECFGDGATDEACCISGRQYSAMGTYRWRRGRGLS
jgi:hypothetical protein